MQWVMGGGGVGTRQVRRYMGSLNGSNSGSLEWALKGGGGGAMEIGASWNPKQISPQVRRS